MTRPPGPDRVDHPRPGRRLADSLLGPFDLTRAVPVTSENLYSGRLVRDRTGQSVMLAFRDRDAQGGFIGEISDPLPVRWTADGAGLMADAVVTS